MLVHQLPSFPHQCEYIAYNEWMYIHVWIQYQRWVHIWMHISIIMNHIIPISMSRHLMKLIRELTIQRCGYMIVLTLDHIRIEVSYIILRTPFLCWSTNYLHFLNNANISLTVQLCLSVPYAYTPCFAYRRCITSSTHMMHLNLIHLCDMIMKCMSM